MERKRGNADQAYFLQVKVPTFFFHSVITITIDIHINHETSSSICQKVHFVFLHVL